MDCGVFESLIPRADFAMDGANARKMAMVMAEICVSGQVLPGSCTKTMYYDLTEYSFLPLSASLVSIL